MYPLGHGGLTLLFGKLLSDKFNLKWRVEWILLASLLPDFLDKPFTIVEFGEGRLFFHSFLFSLILLMVKRELFFGSTVHLILDKMWESPEILLFPILEIEIRGGVHPLDFIQFFLQSKYSQAGEVLGLVSIAICKKRKLF
jgi:hypothetical protein